MRTIKFRGWHTVQKKMFPAEELGADQLTLSVDGRGFVNVHGDRIEFSTFYPPDKFIPMQFTCLLDKNGKEIYEGDVVRLIDKLTGDKTETILSVFWKGSALVLDISDIDDELGVIPLDFAKDMATIEVIGNIYESPELLK